MRLLMVRHVETRANAEKKYLGHSSSEYTEKGKRQIDNLLKLLEKEGIDRLYSSPLSRALKMSEIFSREFGLELIVDDLLKEMNFGIFEGKTYQEAEREFEGEWGKWTRNYINYRIPDGESFMDVYERVTTFIDSLKKRDRTFLLVTHGGIIQTIITYLLDLGIEARWHFKISSAALVKMEYKNDYGIFSGLINI